MATHTTVTCDTCSKRLELAPSTPPITLRLLRGSTVILFADLCEECASVVRKLVEKPADPNRWDVVDVARADLPHELADCEHRWVATRGAWERCELCGAERAAGG